jgi:hypothetical protein
LLKAREFDVKVEPGEPDPGSNPADSGEEEILEDYADDSTSAELKAAIDNLSGDEIVDLIELTWVGVRSQLHCHAVESRIPTWYGRLLPVWRDGHISMTLLGG